MSTTTAAPLLPGLTLVGRAADQQEIKCACGRMFKASTMGRAGVTRSNANRHAARCAVAQAEGYEAAARPLSFLSSRTAGALTPAGAAAVDACRERIAKGTARDVTPKGKVAVMVRASLDVRYSTDGQWIVAKGGPDSNDADPWALYRTVNLGETDREHLALRGTYPTCTAAFAVENLTA